MALPSAMVWATMTLRAAAAAGPSPALPFYDWNACPSEGCSYRQWTARKRVDVFDTWKPGRKAIATLKKGDVVLAQTGVVITYRPGTIRVDRDLPEHGLKRGDIIRTYTYRGEGVCSVSFNGQYYPDFHIGFAKRPDGSGCGGAHCAATYIDLGEKVWWAKVRFKSGRIGWVNMNRAEFDAVDLLARAPALTRNPTFGRAQERSELWPEPIPEYCLEGFHEPLHRAALAAPPVTPGLGGNPWRVNEPLAQFRSYEKSRSSER